MRKRLEKISDFAHSEVEKAAKARDTQTLLYFSQVLRECEALQQAHAGLTAETDELDRRIRVRMEGGQDLAEDIGISHRSGDLSQRPAETRSPGSMILRQTGPPPREKPSVYRSESRKKAREYRETLLKELSGQGIVLERRTEALYKTRAGEYVGIAFATERRPGRWFFGLPVKPEPYRCIILLCEKGMKEGGRKDLLRFILPKEFCARHKDKISMSSDGEQYKFNVMLRNFHYEFQLVGERDIVIDAYEGDLSGVQG